MVVFVHAKCMYMLNVHNKHRHEAQRLELKLCSSTQTHERKNQMNFRSNVDYISVAEYVWVICLFLFLFLVFLQLKYRME